MKITHDMLVKANACNSQVSLFKATFPKGSTVTARAVAKALKVGLNVQFITRFLPPVQKAEYYKVRAPAWAEYNKVRDAALAEYNKVCGTALVNAFKGVK